MELDQAFYLVHSMSNSKEYIELDRLSARNFVKIAKRKYHMLYIWEESHQKKKIYLNTYQAGLRLEKY